MNAHLKYVVHTVLHFVYIVYAEYVECVHTLTSIYVKYSC